MAKTERFEPLTLRQERVLNVLQERILTRDELRAMTKISDEGLGFALCELIDMRKIWTGQQGEIRIYGIERRTGLVPGFLSFAKKSNKLTIECNYSPTQAPIMTDFRLLKDERLAIKYALQRVERE